ncbi:unnamed protein product, partial [Mesorhabditis spiculigera]
MMRAGAACGGDYAVFEIAREALIANRIIDGLPDKNTPDGLKKQECIEKREELLYRLLYSFGPYDEVNFW